MTKQDFEHLLDLHKANPDNVDLIVQIALCLLENPFYSDENVQYYFKLAYSKQKSIENIHNWAWYIYNEITGYTQQEATEKAFNIQKQCIDLKPKSYMPYLLFAEILLERKEYEEALCHFNIAIEKTNNQQFKNNILHNIAVINFHLTNYSKAIEFFRKFQTDKTLYNLFLCYLQTDTSLANSTLKKLEIVLKNGTAENITNLDVAELYSLIGNHKRSYELIEKDGFNFHPSWTELSYSLWQINKPRFLEKVKHEINQNNIIIDEILNEHNHEDWQHLTTKNERYEEIDCLKNENKKLRKLDIQFLNAQPTFNTSNLIKEYTGCLLFGCHKHNNPTKDN